jgi:hypothetical protein
MDEDFAPRVAGDGAVWSWWSPLLYGLIFGLFFVCLYIVCFVFLMMLDCFDANMYVGGLF